MENLLSSSLGIIDAENTDILDKSITPTIWLILRVNSIENPFKIIGLQIHLMTLCHMNMK